MIVAVTVLGWRHLRHPEPEFGVVHWVIDKGILDGRHTILVDDVAVPEGIEFEQRLRRGKHRLLIRRDDRDLEHREFTVPAGGILTYELWLEEPPHTRRER